jgi:hypothetical protein
MRLLDYGCGVGYGIHALMELTEGEGLGVDKEEAVAFARARYPHPRLRYVAADLTAPEARFGAFDVILSFDVIEHVADVGAYLDNIAAQLRDARSVALISTPWSPRPGNVRPLHNPYHEVEYTFTEFCDLLRERFDILELTLTLGIVAVLGRRGEHGDPPFVVPLTTDHVRGMEAMFDVASVSAERLEPLAEAVSDLLAWPDAAGERLVQGAWWPLRWRLRAPEARSYVERCTVEHAGLGGLAFFLRGRVAHGFLDVTVLHQGEPVTQESLPACLLSGRAGHRLVFPPAAIEPGEVVEVRFAARGMDLRALGLTAQPTGEPRCQLLYRRFHWRGAPGYVHDVTWMRADGDGLVAFRWPTVPEDAPPPPKPRALPPLDDRPWPRDAGIATKTWRSLRAYGLRATLREIAGYLRGR